MLADFTPGEKRTSGEPDEEGGETRGEPNAHGAKDNFIHRLNLAAASINGKYPTPHALSVRPEGATSRATASRQA